MSYSRHKVFISYHHRNDQLYKEQLLRINRDYDIFIDGSVDTGDVDDSLPNETIRQTIRDRYLVDTTVTLLLVGTETKKRKHIDWELKSSMIDGAVNKKSGILVINLPSTSNDYFTAAHQDEKEVVYPGHNSWMTIDNRNEYERRYPFLPARIIDNLLKPNSLISVVNWSTISSDPEKLRFLINATFLDRLTCMYDLARPMMRRNL